MMAPRYQEIKTADIPVASLPGGVQVRVICGEAGGVSGPVEGVVIEPQYLDMSVPAEVEYTHPTPPGHTVIVYVIAGMGRFCPEDHRPGGGRADAFQFNPGDHLYSDQQPPLFQGNRSLIVFSDGDEIRVKASPEGVRFLLMAGRPIREPVAWSGPIVMNTNEELRQAYEDLQNGTFIKG
jgi:redox-sensitive bicupin YhaK (pirin superfamily)